MTKKCPYRKNCKYYIGKEGKCDTKKYIECSLVEFSLIEDLINKNWEVE